MALQVVVHIHNEDPFVAEMEHLPDPKDNFVAISRPRRRDGKSLSFITDGMTSMLYPWSRIAFIEVIGGERDGNAEGVVSFFREDSRAR
ncbi:MAG TPA: hypothetical protein VFI42_19195 [Thermomicrobiaceae bacterium]|nr:hypothetical protein [Thermomicrobiaceae bacterium]